MRVHLSFAILLTTACSTTTTTNTTTPSPTRAEPATSAQAPRLFSLDVDGGQCHGRIRTLGTTTTTQTLFSTTSTSLTAPCPTSVVIDGPRDRVLAVHEDKVVSWSRGVRTVIATLPTPAGLLSLVPELSVTSTGVVRVAQIVVDGVTVIDGTPQKIRYADREITITDEMGLPPWGESAVAVLNEHTATGWKQIEVTPTKIDAGDTPGLGALSTSTAAPAGVVVIAERQRAMTCVGGLRCDGDDAALMKTIAAGRTKRDGDVEAVGQLEHGGAFYTWATMWGDTPHAMRPLYRCTDKRCATKTIVDDRDDTRQLALATSGDFLLIAAEYDNTHPIVLDATGTPLSIVPATSTSVVFLP